LPLAGLDCDVSDEAVFLLFDSAGSIIGILALHVDDTIGGGTPSLFDAMRLICSVLKIGAEESAKDGPFLYAGLRISTCPIMHGKCGRLGVGAVDRVRAWCTDEVRRGPARGRGCQSRVVRTGRACRFIHGRHTSRR
jgi:hypothetical protein